jgi:hypothetical protein
MSRRWMVVLLAIGCGGGSERPAPPQAAKETAPPDSLALTAPGGVEVWYTMARTGKAVNGETCVDRTLEIRRGDTRIPVPLLYTGTPPELIDDSTIRARLSDACQPGDAYRVNLRTGRPVRER